MDRGDWAHSRSPRITPSAFLISLIWIALIGSDRIPGYGLKFPTIFRDTHLNPLLHSLDLACNN
jgi:hypothetical protein